MQNVLFLQDYEWVSSGKKIIKIMSSYENRGAVIILNSANKQILYTTIKPVFFNKDHITSARDYIDKVNKEKFDIINWINREFSIEL